MSVAIQILQEARQAGLDIRMEGADLKIRGTAEVFRTMAPALQAHKKELIALLGGGAPAVPAPTAEPGPALRGSWLVRFPGQEPIIVTTTPRALAEIQSWHPGAVVEAIPEPIAPLACVVRPTSEVDFRAIVAELTEDLPQPVDAWRWQDGHGRRGGIIGKLPGEEAVIALLKNHGIAPVKLRRARQ
jgi:hypothetical protein